MNWIQKSQRFHEIMLLTLSVREKPRGANNVLTSICLVSYVVNDVERRKRAERSELSPPAILTVPGREISLIHEETVVHDDTTTCVNRREVARDVPTDGWLASIHYSHGPSILNTGAWIDSPRQTGQRPGRLRRSRFSKTNPHFVHSAGWTTRRLPVRCRDWRMCSRWPATSFSGMPTRPERSRADRGPCSSSDTIW